MPTFIEPYPIVKANSGTLNYTKKLPIELEARIIHPAFNVSPLRSHIFDEENQFQLRNVQINYNFEYCDETLKGT